MPANSRGSPSACLWPSVRRATNQHHLPPLYPLTSMRSEAVPSRPPPSPLVRKLSDAPYRRGSDRNYCSVSTVPTGADAVHYGAGAAETDDVVGYAVKHQLPLLLNTMMRDLLLERPEADVDGWMMRWFEREHERQERSKQQHADASVAASIVKHVEQGQQSEQPQVSESRSTRRTSRSSVATSPEEVRFSMMSSSFPSTTSCSTVVIPLPQCRLGAEAVRVSTPGSSVSHSCTIVMHPPEERKATVVQVEPPRTVITRFPSRSPGAPVAPTIIVPRSVPPPQERRPQRIGEEKEQQQMTVLRMPRTVDYRTKTRTPQYLDINGGDGAAPKAT